MSPNSAANLWKCKCLVLNKIYIIREVNFSCKFVNLLQTQNLSRTIAQVLVRVLESRKNKNNNIKYLKNHSDFIIIQSNLHNIITRRIFSH